MLKLVITGRRKPGQTLRAHRRHMKDVHGPLVLENIAVEPERAPHRYVQNHVCDGTFAAGSGPLSLARDFVTEVWFPDGAVAKASRETPFYLERLRDDEDNMVDPASVIGMPTVETLVSTDRAAAACPIKVFGLLAFADGVEPAAFEPGWKAALPGVAKGKARQHVASRPLVKTPISWIDAFWLPDEEAAQDFAARYQTDIIAPLEAAGLLAGGGSNVLIARQYVLHAGERQFDIRYSEEFK